MNKTKAGSVYCGFRQNWQIAPNFLGKIFKTVAGVVGKVVTSGAKLAITTIVGGSIVGAAPTSVREPINIVIQQPQTPQFEKSFMQKYGIMIAGGVVAIIMFIMVMRK